MGRRRSNILQDLFEIGGMLPWWLSVLLALGIYAVLHHFAVSDPVVAAHPKEALGTLFPNAFRQVAVYAQYIVPWVLIVGMLTSVLRRATRAQLFTSVLDRHGARDLDELSWSEFEELVHELFRRQGYAVVSTAPGPDGGIDLELRKSGRFSTVQCKHWRGRKVDVKTVREQLGVMTASGADNCFVVTAGDYTDAAKQFARGQPVTLIDSRLLRVQLATLQGNRPEEPRLEESAEPACPSCKGRMVRRTAKRGRNSGNDFWGCSRFPTCHGTRELEAEERYPLSA